MKSILNVLDENINLIDIGCSGKPQSQWEPIESKLKYFGFDPNKEECARLSAIPNNFNSSIFLPYAIAGFTGKANLHVTKSLYCTSLLEPNYKWLSRFEFSDLFTLKSKEEINVTSLDDAEELKQIDVDIIKCDSQGLELEILKSAKKRLKDAIYVETESGFHANYINESTQAEVDIFMRQSGFILFDVLLKRMPLNNPFKDHARKSAQVLWCECKWIKDLLTIEQNNEFQKLNLTRSKALKYLLICAVNGAYDYGFEYAKIFNKYNLIDNEELERLSKIDHWKFTDNNEPGANKSVISSFVKKLLKKNINLSSALLNRMK
jgi:FkbM family methyltransferase